MCQVYLVYYIVLYKFTIIYVLENSRMDNKVQSKRSLNFMNATRLKKTPQLYEMK
jgi:hypothetical protein